MTRIEPFIILYKRLRPLIDWNSLITFGISPSNLLFDISIIVKVVKILLISMSFPFVETTKDYIYEYLSDLIYCKPLVLLSMFNIPLNSFMYVVGKCPLKILLEMRERMLDCEIGDNSTMELISLQNKGLTILVMFEANIEMYPLFIITRVQILKLFEMD